MSDVPRGWAQVALGDVVDEAKPGFPSGRHNKLGEGVPHLRPMNVNRDGRIDLAAVKYVVSKDGARIRSGEVLFNNTNSPALVGKTAYFDRQGDWAYSNHMTRLRPCAAVNSKFLALQLHWYWMRGVFLEMCSHHVNQASVSTRILLERVRIELPPLAEQRRIVAAIEEQLSRLDAAEGSLRHARAKIGPLRDSGISSALSANWPTAPLGSLVCEPLRNGHSAKAAPGGTVRTLTPTAVTVGDFSEANTKLTAADPDRVKHLWLEPGDVFIERSNTPELVGTAALYRGPRNWAIFPDLLIRVRVADSLLPEFLDIVLKSRRVRRYFQTSAQGIAGSMPKIDQGVVERLDLPVPRLEEQRSVIETVEQQLSLVDALAAAVDAALRRSAALRRAILARAFAGELVPQDPSDEPASALLERIRASRSATGIASRPRRRDRTRA